MVGWARTVRILLVLPLILGGSFGDGDFGGAEMTSRGWADEPPSTGKPLVPAPPTLEASRELGPERPAPQRATPPQPSKDRDWVSERVVDPAAAATILRLRSLMGDPLAGTSLAEDASNAGDSSFAAALERVAASQEESRPAEETRLAPPPALEPAPDRAPSGELACTDIVAFRKAARQLERTADMLEDLRCYDDADQLRQLATRLRQAAREADRAAVNAVESALRQALPLAR